MAIKSPQGFIVDLPRGTQDLGTKDAIALKEILSIIEEVFKRYGFSPIETPSIENTAILNAKAYGEQSKELYILEGGETALRFDLTVPLARYMAMNRDITLPFKRFQTGRVWRKDEPQKMREREFVQADIDIVGSKDIRSDAECIAASAEALASCEITEFTILINSRGVLNTILDSYGIKNETQVKAIRIIDKILKIGFEDTLKQLTSLGIDQANAQKLLDFLSQKGSNEEKLNKLAINVPNTNKEIDELTQLLKALSNYDIKGDVQIDFSLARGLDYYTGFVWEVVAALDGQRAPSIASGGRYDNLIGMYSKNPIPAVGSSIGVSRVFELLRAKTGRKSYAKVFIANIGKENIEYSMQITRKLRAAGIYTDLNVAERGISKQLDHANWLGISHVAIIGSKEKEAGKVNLRDMSAGTEELLDVDALISRLKK